MNGHFEWVCVLGGQISAFSTHKLLILKHKEDSQPKYQHANLIARHYKIIKIKERRSPCLQS
jgi:hypothetical protein